MNLRKALEEKEKQLVEQIHAVVESEEKSEFVVCYRLKERAVTRLRGTSTRYATRLRCCTQRNSE